jgi:hypothetical protein
MSRAEELFQRMLSKGLEAIDDLITTEKSEEHFLDFKRSSNAGASRTLSDSDRETLAKAVSGFANTDGGVIVWGVGKASGRGADLAGEKHPIADCKRFAALLDDAVSGCTVPPVRGVRSAAMVSDEHGNGFVVTLIPPSADVPHQCVKRSLYYIRAGSSFQPATHGLLSGMFGRPPRPHLDINFVLEPAKPLNLPNEDFRVYVGLAFMLVNASSTLASDVYLSWRIEHAGGPNVACHRAFRSSDEWAHTDIGGRIGSGVSRPGFRLAPQAVCKAAAIGLWFFQPLDGPFTLEVHYSYCVNKIKALCELLDSLVEDR